MKRFNLSKISLHDLLVVGLPLILLVALGFWMASRFVQPGPPHHVVISTGAAGGAYHVFAERYRDILAKNGITLELRPSSGSIENVGRLKSDDSDVDIAFVQAGVVHEDEDSELISLGNIYYEPVWVFYSGTPTMDRLTQFRGKRIATGGESSGTQLLALQLLIASGFTTDDPNLLTLSGDAALAALQKGDVNAVFFIAAPEAPAIQQLLQVPGIKLMSFTQAEAYARRVPALSVVTLPEGGVDLVNNIPAHDTLLIAPTAHLVARAKLHPALITLLAKVLKEVHGGPGLFGKNGEFPAFRDQDFPVSADAERYYKSGPPFLQRYLPFWLAVFVDRAFVMVIPLIVLLIPALRYMPTLYAWRIRSRIFRLYGELKFLESEIRRQHTREAALDLAKRLDAIEELANARPIPLSYTGELYELRTHINLVRGVLARATTEQRDLNPVT